MTAATAVRNIEQITSSGLLVTNRPGFRHSEVPGLRLCGCPRYLKEILFKVKEILLSIRAVICNHE